MVSVNSATLNAITAANTLSLFKDASQTKATTAVQEAPTIQASSSSRMSAIADLPAKLVDIKKATKESNVAVTTSGGGTWNESVYGDDVYIPPLPEQIGDGTRPLTEAQRAENKANWEAWEKKFSVDDVAANFHDRAIDALMRNEYYANDPSFQDAVKNDTLTITRGDEVGLENPGMLPLIFDDNGYYFGSGGGGKVWRNAVPESVAKIVGGRLMAADGQRAASGFVNALSFYVTWPGPEKVSAVA